jgi:hypothetical protein
MSNIVSFTNARRSTVATTRMGWMASGFIDIYTTPRPSTADTAISTQTKLVRFVFKSPAGTVSNGVITASAIDPALNLGTGTAVFARLLDSSEVVICDGDCGATGSGAFVELDSVSIVAGAMSTITAFSLTEG